VATLHRGAALLSNVSNAEALVSVTQMHGFAILCASAQALQPCFAPLQLRGGGESVGTGRRRRWRDRCRACSRSVRTTFHQGGNGAAGLAQTLAQQAGDAHHHLGA